MNDQEIINMICRLKENRKASLVKIFNEVSKLYAVQNLGSYPLLYRIIKVLKCNGFKVSERIIVRAFDKVVPLDDYELDQKQTLLNQLKSVGSENCDIWRKSQ